MSDEKMSVVADLRFWTAAVEARDAEIVELKAALAGKDAEIVRIGLQEKFLHATAKAEQQRADKAESALADLKAEREADAERFRWGVENARWIRHEHEAYVAIPVAFSADLSCYATRVRAIDDAREGVSHGS